MLLSLTKLLREVIQKYRVRKILSSNYAIKLNLGCGNDYLQGYVNIDSFPGSKTDLVMDAKKLEVFPDKSVEVIESYHFFEHLTYHQAKNALRSWCKILKPGGKLLIELPNFEVCISELGKHYDDKGYDLALSGIFGYPWLVENEGLTQCHKWGWTFESISKEISDSGFTNISKHPIKQTWRVATSFSRDMQIRAERPKNDK